MAGPILAVAEHFGGEVESVTHQVIVKGRQLADACGANLVVAVFGEGADAAAAALKDKGADRIVVLDHALLDKAGPEVRAEAVATCARKLEARLVLVGFSLTGMELTPAIAARLGAVPLTNCVGVEAREGTFAVTRPVFDGLMHTRLVLEANGVAVVGLQKGATPSKPLSGPAVAIERMALDFKVADNVSELVEIVVDPVGAFDITKTDVLVSAGRGIGTPDKLPVIEELAAALGGLMSCSRPIVDMGWLPKERQVGASGKTVQPKVYIACGISGASQHLAGMSEAHTIIAINKDPNAPIYQVAHYGIVGDLFEIVPALTKAARG